MRPMVPVSMVVCAVALAACGTSTSISKFQGAEHEAAQAIANLQSDVASSEQKKLCTRDLSAAVVTRLGGTKACEHAIEEQLKQIDSTEIEVKSVKVSGDRAAATVESVFGGKKRSSTINLVKEGGSWKIASLSGP